MARREEDGEVGEAPGSPGRSSRSLCDIKWMLRVRWIGRRWTMVRDFAGEELSGRKRSGGDALGSRRKRRGGSGRMGLGLCEGGSEEV